MSKEEKHPEKSAGEKPKVGKRKRGRKRKGMCLDDRPVLEPNAAGIDIGAREIFVAVPPDRDENPVRVFLPFTEDLQEMAKWLVSRGITVAGESGHHHSGDGIHRGVLDSAAQRVGAIWGKALFSGRTRHEERAGPAHGLGTNASGCSFCIRWGCCERPFGRRAMCAQYGR